MAPTDTRPPVPYGRDDKRTAVRDMFDRIAPGYDRVNQLMTFGLDRRWRAMAAEAAGLARDGVALDLGTGTGDLALALARRVPNGRVVGLDYAGRMLARAPAKAESADLANRVSWVRGDGQALPFPDGTFDAVASAFVLRNFAHLDRALVEMARVLVPGGRAVALEASPTGPPGWRQLVRLHFRLVVPVLGRLVAGDPGAYRYLGASVGAFLSPAELAVHLSAAGLEPEPPIVLMGGAVVVHRGRKPERRLAA